MDLPRKTLVLTSLTFLTWISMPSVAGQDTPSAAQPTAPAASAPAPDSSKASEVDIIEIFHQGGWTMWPLLGLSVATFALIVYNLIAIRPHPFLRPDLVKKLKPAFSQLDFEQAREICEKNPSVITNIVVAGLDRADPDHLVPEDMKTAMEETSTSELSAPFTMISSLSSIASISPMIGLLGTVSGMIKAFSNISAKGMGQAAELAANIQEALITTAAGLIIAIPAMLGYLYFKGVYVNIASKVSRNAGDIFYEMIKSTRRLP